MFKIFSIFSFLFVGFLVHGQDTLLLLNGKTLIVDISDDSGANVFFEVKNKKGNLKSYNVPRSELFSIIKEGQEESILYIEDPDIGYDLSIEDMRFYMAGQEDARQGYKTWPSMAGGAAFGAATVFFMEGGFVPFTAPFIYGFAMQIPYVKIRESSISDKRSVISDYYVEGYNKTARSKKLLSNFAATMVGVIAGSVAYELSQ